MLPPRSLPQRIPRLLRPLRPPSNHVRPKTPRFFTTNSQLLLISSTPPVRPQLPFLHAPSTGTLPPRVPPLRQPVVPRPLSTERRKKITQGIKVALTCYAIVVLFYVMQEGFYQQKVEGLFPTPPDWSFWSRWDLRCARALQNPEMMGKIATDWARVALYYKDLLARLEDPKGADGKGLIAEDGGDGELVVDGVGKVGIDVEGMSEAWKQGYFEALMGSAETAEKLDGWVLDTARGVVAPAEYVIGPGNPNARPPPPGKTVGDLPQEENCVAAYESPEVFYVKVLTANGFRTNQRLDAALAYADWLDFKGLRETAGAAYEWAMDIAASGVPTDPSEVVDVKSGVLKSTELSHVTDNLLRASTAMGVHQVRRGDLGNALSTFLSVLRARRNLSQPPALSQSQKANAKNQDDNAPFSAITSSISSFFNTPPYPIPTHTGDEQALRTHSSACEEAGLMVYIGEIIFASSSPERGLSWTRDAVDTAELSILQLEDDEHENASSTTTYAAQFSTPQARCQDCLKAGLENWKKMVRKLVVKAEDEELEAMDRAKASSSSWWGSSRDQKQLEEKMLQRRRWEAEEMILKDRANTVGKLIGDQGLAAFASGTALLLG